MAGEAGSLCAAGRQPCAAVSLGWAWAVALLGCTVVSPVPRAFLKTQSEHVALRSHAVAFLTLSIVMVVVVPLTKVCKSQSNIF